MSAPEPTSAGLLGAPPDSFPVSTSLSHPVRPSVLAAASAASVFSQCMDVLLTISSPSNEKDVFNPFGLMVKPVANPASWSDVVQNGGNCLTSDLKFFPPSCAVGVGDCISPREVLDQRRRIWGSSLYGYFFDIPPHFWAVSSIVSLLWSRYGLVHTASTGDGFFLFRLSSLENMEKCWKVGPWMIAGKALCLKRFHPGLKLSRDSHDSFPIWVKFCNVPVDFWTPLGLAWVASSIGAPLHLCPKTAKMELLEVARICVEVSADTALPSRIFLHSYESKIEVDVEYSWNPSKCRLCLLFGHEEVKCKAVKSSSTAGSPPRKIALPNCHPKSSSHSADLPFVVDCPGLAVKVFADSQKKAPASVSSPSAAVNMDAVGCGSSVGKQHNGVVREAEFLLAELGSEPGHSVSSGEGFPSVSLSGAKLRGPIGSNFLVDDGGQSPFVDVEEACQPINLSPLVSPIDRLLEGLGPVESRLQCFGGASDPSSAEIQAGLADSVGVRSSPDPNPSISLVSLLEEHDYY